MFFKCFCFECLELNDFKVRFLPYLYEIWNDWNVHIYRYLWNDQTCDHCWCSSTFFLFSSRFDVCCDNSSINVWMMCIAFDTYSSKLQFNENKIKINRKKKKMESFAGILFFCPFVRIDRIEHHQFCMVWRQTVVDSIKITRKNVRVCVFLKFEWIVRSTQDWFNCIIEHEAGKKLRFAISTRDAIEFFFE